MAFFVTKLRYKLANTDIRPHMNLIPNIPLLIRLRRNFSPVRMAWYFVSLWVFVSIFSDFIANDRPLTCVISSQRRWPICQKMAEQHGWTQYDAALRNFDFSTAEQAIWPLLRFAANTYDPPRGVAAPDQTHLLGTHDLGRDVAAGLLSGARKALIVGLVSVLLAVAVGLFFGSIAGMSRQRNNGALATIFSADALILRILEVYQSMPNLLLLLVLAGIIERPTIWHICGIIAIIEWPIFAQLIRTELRKIRQLDYIQAAQALGLSPFRIFWRHALPNALGSTLVASAFIAGQAILIESSLSFLGIGLPPDEVSWGNILNSIRAYPSAWWLAVYPGLALFAVIASLYTIGQHVRQR